MGKLEAPLKADEQQGDVRNELESHDQVYAQTGFHFLP